MRAIKFESGGLFGAPSHECHEDVKGAVIVQRAACKNESNEKPVRRRALS